MRTRSLSLRQQCEYRKELVLFWPAKLVSLLGGMEKIVLGAMAASTRNDRMTE